ncbi:hypothetical protein T484DRAFT_2402658 [Baffinella frigidus]|nr:hypothetical protein T484DRAFT_2402658 [Cryptophyta sp. CCMP2293]
MLDGVKLKDMVEWLVRDVGYDEMWRRTGIKTFAENPSVPSSLKMLRKPGNEWTRSVPTNPQGARLLITDY